MREAYTDEEMSVSLQAQDNWSSLFYPMLCSWSCISVQYMVTAQQIFVGKLIWNQCADNELTQL